MFRKLVKAIEIEVDGIGYPLRFYELKTARGAQRFSCEVCSTRRIASSSTTTR